MPATFEWENSKKVNVLSAQDVEEDASFVSSTIRFFVVLTICATTKNSSFEDMC